MAAGAGVGCSNERTQERPLSNLLWEAEPTELLAEDQLLRHDFVEVASFRSDKGLPPRWSAAGGMQGSRGRCLEVGGDILEIQGPASAELASADRLEAEVEGLKLRHVIAAWNKAIDPQDLAARRSWAEASGPGRTRVSWDLDTLSPTRGEGEVVRLRFLGEADRPVCVVSIRGVVDRTDQARQRELAGRTWRVDLDGEVRPARLAPPAFEPIELNLTGLGSRRFRLGYGKLGREFSTLRFRARLLGPSGERELFSIELPADAMEGWRDLVVEVPEEFVATAVRLEASVDDEASRVYPVWSHFGAERIAAKRKSPNVLLISIDTLRADRLSFMGAERLTSPGLDAWVKKRGVVFERAIAQAPWTLPSHISMLSGWNAHEHGVNVASEAPATVPLLQEVLASAGYRTRAVTGSGYLDPRYGFSRGFERYRYWKAQGNIGEIAHGFEWAARFLEELKEESFFLFFHTYEVHGPYRAHQPYFDRFSSLRSDMFVMGSPVGDEIPGERERRHTMMMFPPGQRELQTPLTPELAGLPLDLYDSGVASADHWVSRLLDRVEELGLGDETLVIITSDHGEALGEHGIGGHGYLYDDNLWIPLVVGLPGGRTAGVRIAKQVRSIDIVPTVLDVLGLGGAHVSAGRSLLPLIERPTASFEREAWSYSASLGVSLRVDDRLKFLFHDGVVPKRSQLDRIFRVDEDPGELRDLAPAHEARSALEKRTLEELRRTARGLTVRMTASPGAGLSATLKAPWLSRDVPKWLRQPQDDAVWKEVDALEVVVPAGESVELLLRSVAVPREPLSLRVASRTGSSFWSIEPSAVVDAGQRTRIYLTESGLVLEKPRSARSISAEFEFGWAGAAREMAQDPASGDPELRERLRALGYLN